MMQMTKISPVSGNDLPVSWASKAEVSPDDAVQIIIQPFMVGKGSIEPVDVLRSDGISAESQSPKKASSYLLRCKLHHFNQF